jgi:hypothetical protein
MVSSISVVSKNMARANRHEIFMCQVALTFGTVDCSTSPSCYIMAVTSSAASTRLALLPLKLAARRVKSWEIEGVVRLDRWGIFEHLSHFHKATSEFDWR